MVEGLRVVQRAGVTGFAVFVQRVGTEFEYDIRGRTDSVKTQEIAEVLFSIALELQASCNKGTGQVRVWKSLDSAASPDP